MPKSPSLTSAELMKRSDALRKQAEDMKSREMPGVVARMKEAIARYGLTATDLGLASAVSAAAGKRGKPGRRKGGVKVGKRGPSVIRYRDTEGHEWSGFGPKPRWFKEALANGVSESALKA